jgi:membrane protease YdiL (CAAX protease family)
MKKEEIRMTSIPISPVSAPAPAPLIASRKHTVIFFLIVAAVTILGIVRAHVAAAKSGTTTSQIVPYLVLIGVQLLWVRFVHKGMKSQGHSLSELTGGRWLSPRNIAMDLLFGTLGLFVLFAAAEGLKVALGEHANIAFLMPHGLTESLLWVALSITAGICEEIVFRGYLQRQLIAMTGSAALGIVLQAVIFGVAHGYQGLKPIAVTGTVGLVLGILAWYRGNIRAGAIAHAVTDILGGLTRF